MDPVQVILGVVIGAAVVLTAQAIVAAVRHRRPRSERDEAIRAAEILATRELEEYIRSSKQSSARLQ